MISLFFASSLKPIPTKGPKRKQTCLSPSLSSAPAAPRRARVGIGEDEERRRVETEKGREKRERRESKSLSFFSLFFPKKNEVQQKKTQPRKKQKTKPLSFSLPSRARTLDQPPLSL
jgi:hypothetical protein